jgi:hypothetical protein
LVGGSPGPSAKATAANDMSNSVTARMRFIGDSPYRWGIPQGDSLVGNASAGAFRPWNGQNPNGGVAKFAIDAFRG